MAGRVRAAGGEAPAERTWAIGGCSGIDRHVATCLVADSEHVVDVPSEATGQGRKTDATDAHSVALVGKRMTGLRNRWSDVSEGMDRETADVVAALFS